MAHRLGQTMNACSCLSCRASKRSVSLSLALCFATLATLHLSQAMQPASAQQQQQSYTLNGKPITKQQYEAGVLLNESIGLLQSNRNQEAADKLSKAAELDPSIPEVKHNLGIALAKLGRSDEALENLEAARQLNPTLDATWLSLGGVYQTQGRILDAVKTYKEFLTRFPKHRDATKVASLVQGLEKEMKMSGNSGQTSAPTDDYVKEITRQGVLRWPTSKMPLKVFIRNGQGVPGFDPSNQQLLTKSFQDWATASNGAVSFSFIKDPKQSDIECSWTNNPNTFTNKAEAGETNLMGDKAGLCRGTIKLLTVPLVPELPLTENRMRMIYLHEIGHVLGLAGHTNNPQDIMFYSVNVADVWRDLTPRDGNTLMRLYTMNYAPSN